MGVQQGYGVNTPLASSTFTVVLLINRKSPLGNLTAPDRSFVVLALNSTDTSCLKVGSRALFRLVRMLDAEILILVISGRVIWKFVVPDDGKGHGLFVMTRG